MDAHTAAALAAVAKIIQTLGLKGVVLVCLCPTLLVPTVTIWLYVTFVRRIDRMVELYRKDMREAVESNRKDVQEVLRENTKLVNRYGDAVDEVGQYYKDNVELVRGFERMTRDFTGIISLNTQTMTKVVDRIESNQFCPMVKSGMKA